MKGLVQRCLKRAGAWAAGPVALIAGLGAHVTALAVLGALVMALAVLACLTWRWTLHSNARSDRGIRMILALRGDPRSLPQRPSAQPPAGSPRHPPGPRPRAARSPQTARRRKRR